MKYNCNIGFFNTRQGDANFYVVGKNFQNDSGPFSLVVSEIFRSVLEVYRVYVVCIMARKSSSILFILVRTYEIQSVASLLPRFAPGHGLSYVCSHCKTIC